MRKLCGRLLLREDSVKRWDEMVHGYFIMAKGRQIFFLFQTLAFLCIFFSQHIHSLSPFHLVT